MVFNKMARLTALLCTVVLTSALCAGQPNVVLILTDDQGYGDLGCHGNELIKTPHIDKLHAESVRFTDYHVSNVCAPTRAALMAGQYSSHVGVWHTLAGRDLVRSDAVMMPQAFAESGYKTQMVGKWHIGDNYPFRPEDRGFQEVFRIGGGSPGQIADYWGNGIFNTRHWNGKQWLESDGFCTDVQFDAAMSFIKKSKDNPFFIYLATTAVHSPVGAPDEYLKIYDGQDKEIQSFYAMTSNLDWNVGRLRGFLKDQKLDQNTIFIFMTDNGSACDKKGTAGAYNADLRGKKGSNYEGGHRVPFFLHWPAKGLSKAIDVDQLTAHIDVFPTLIELCGLEKPSGYVTDGLSLVPLINDPNLDWQSRILITEGKVNKRDKPYESSTVMSGKLRLIPGNNELYHIGKDPRQKKNIALDNDVEVRRLRKAYDVWYKKMTPEFSKVPRIAIGNPAENPSRLTAMDVMSKTGTGNAGKPIWNQKAVSSGELNHGYWQLNVAQGGTYKIQLRRWPQESELNFGDNPKQAKRPSKSTFKEAFLEIGNFKETSPVDPAQASVDFTVELEKGPIVMDASLVTTKGEKSSAYYVDITLMN